ncbi:cysteine desulfurase family protein [Alteribacillus bidgolensis]|uniref:cysteine desulfurase n=1 Tax=Alteribacillus bidgolensis TaxID=930129 RepID=A0A1G8E6Y4_9BACI|nr:cysteine desulfurase family protein [Alteribacillus bidgolensis]SDH65696.1 cysteine desulfurase [Alteribacillus bidgolensis]
MENIYMDYNASTPLAPEVKETITRLLDEAYGNPSASHWAGSPAKTAVEKARRQVASLIGAASEEVIFTSGGTESNNHVLKGIVEANRGKDCHIVTTKAEHPAILKPCRYLEQYDVSVTYVDTDTYGKINPADIDEAITEKTVLVSVMHANNETGTVQPLEQISAITKRHGIPFHTDASQSLGKIPVNVDKLSVDFLTIAGHKLYAPKGIGALYIRNGKALPSFMHGAGHEQGRRAGTENVILAGALGQACQTAQYDKRIETIQALRDDFWERLQESFGARVHLNGHPEERLPNTLNVSFIGYTGQEILARIPEVAASTGAACHSDTVELSNVLQAMGVDEETGKGAIRFSLGRYSEAKDTRTVVEMLKEVLG